ncbi:MAG: hypothetical protein QOK48_327 [Blastocatellia bacterium]|jgi:hypothetical protein|nr:hypothetical protein [Blastocatellia bacterium]
MADNFSYDVFLSHSSKDKAVVRAIAERLKNDGVEVWFDEWLIKPGDNIPHKIEEGLENSRVLVLCMSRSAFGSDWATLESHTFRFRDPLNKERRFIPLRMDDSPIKGSLAQFSYIQWLPECHQQEYPKLLEGCRALNRARMRQDGVNKDILDPGTDTLLLLQSEFQTHPDNYIALMHVKVDWLEGSTDPTRMNFKRIAGPGVSEEVTLKGGEDYSFFPGVHLSPEFWLSFWYDTPQHRFYPNRTCKHWVTIRDGSVANALLTWTHFRSLAIKAGELIQSMGLRRGIHDPLQRWLIVLHDTIKPTRIEGGMVDTFNDKPPLPETIRVGNMQISPQWSGCSKIDDLYEASYATCRILGKRH